MKIISIAKNWTKPVYRYYYHAVCLVRDGIWQKNIDTIEWAKQVLTLIEAVELKRMPEKN
ncbi:hypothetical protein [Enterococcus haemoperoxidus]|uniref:hypothetical protein n=1 Tax=Enterococcus haemoperoxidus TaxID=155618 RepID=UPI0003A24423|nr:hypothetical protein [Enterococcus haemoperoxidus]OJG54153.1 hypothetical protein RV06_GL003106 [Enterococcus haemoperoxidus]